MLDGRNQASKYGERCVSKSGKMNTKSTFCTVWTKGFLCKEKDGKLCNQLVWYKLKTSDFDPIGRNQACGF